MTQQSFPPNRAAGLARMARFQASMGRHYASTRNYDLGPDDRSNLSVLSPYIRHRLIPEQEVARAALDRFSLSTAEKFVQEVCWRTYWKGWLQHRPKVWEDYKEVRDAAFLDLQNNRGLSTAYDEAVEGRTGIAVFDAWARELIETGYLANHSRMWFSSIWIFTLKLPWALGADLFLQHLMDADAASNTLSWRWTAGLHTQGKTYLARASNIEKYAGERFQTELGPDWRAGLERLANAAYPIDGTPNPGLGAITLPDAVPESPVALLLTEEDLHPASLLADTTKVTAVAGISFPHDRSPKGAGQMATTFTNGAVNDALRASQTAHGVPSTNLDGSDFILSAISWAKASGASTIVTGEPPIGWVKPHIDALKIALGNEGIPLVYIRRAWDDAFWPHAKKGFFGLKKKMPSVLAELGLPA